MPALPSPGNVLRVQLNIGIGASIEAGSRFFVSYSGGTPNTTDLNTLSTDIADAWETAFAAEVCSSEALHGVICTDLSSDTGAEGLWSGTKSGSSGGTQLSSSVCVVVNHEIDRRYRGGRPRTYLRGGTATDLNQTNEWSTTFQSAFLADWQAFIAAVLATTGISITLSNIVNVSYYSGNTVFTTPTGRARNIPVVRDTPVVDHIVDSTVALKIGSQRRRNNL